MMIPIIGGYIDSDDLSDEEYSKYHRLKKEGKNSMAFAMQCLGLNIKITDTENNKVYYQKIM